MTIKEHLEREKLTKVYIAKGDLEQVLKDYPVVSEFIYDGYDYNYYHLRIPEGLDSVALLIPEVLTEKDYMNEVPF